MRVRAIADGTFQHPQIGECYASEGDIFDIPDEPFFILDGDGNKIPEIEIILKDGLEIKQPKRDKRTGAQVFKSASWFTPTWMEKVTDDTPLTPIEKQPMRTVIDVWNKKETKQPRHFSEMTGGGVI